MSSRKLQEFDEYHYGTRGVLQRGDKFRVSGGPFYENDDGTKTLMAERGVFVFRRYCEKGASKWIEATRVGGGAVVLWVGKAGPNKDLPSFRASPTRSRRSPGGSVRAGRNRRPARQSMPYARPSGRWARARMSVARPRQRSRPARRRAGPSGPSGGQSPRPKLGLPRPGREVGQNAGKTGSRKGQVEGEALPLPLSLPQFEPGFYGLF